MIDLEQLKTYIISPVLQQLGLYSPAAINLMLGTCAQESALGTYLVQSGGIALGIYQTEPATHQDVWDNYLKFQNYLHAQIISIAPRSTKNLVFNLAYATAIARCVYARVAEPLPDENDVRGLAEYWKTHYNTSLGAGTIDQFITNYQKYIRKE